MRLLANVLDIVAAIMAVLAVLFAVGAAPTISNGPEFVQIALFSLMLAIIPYCLAGAVHRLVQRR